MFSCILVLWSIFKQTFDLPFFRLSITFRYKWLFQCLQMVIFGFCRGTMALILWLTTGCLSCQWCKESPEIKAMLKCLKWKCGSEKKREQSNVWLFLKKSTKNDLLFLCHLVHLVQLLFIHCDIYLLMFNLMRALNLVSFTERRPWP